MAMSAVANPFCRAARLLLESQIDLPFEIGGERSIELYERKEDDDEHQPEMAGEQLRAKCEGHSVLLLGVAQSIAEPVNRLDDVAVFSEPHAHAAHVNVDGARVGGRHSPNFVKQIGATEET